MKNREIELLMVDAYSQRLFKSAFLLCGNESDANDLTQETLLQAIKSLKSFRHESTLFTWLYGILLNLNRRRTRQKRQFFFFSVNKFPKQISINPISLLEKRMDLEKIYSFIYKQTKKLSLNHREVIILRYFEGFTIEKIAFTLEVSKGTVKSRLHYATKYLRKKIPEHLNPFAVSGTK